MGEDTLKKTDVKGTVIGLIIIFFVGWLIVKGCSSDSGTASKPEIETHDKSWALVMSQGFVEKRLKAPGSADFGSDLSGVSQVSSTPGHEVYNVSSYVDSQNSFGAKLRVNYTCKITFNGATAQCDDLVLDE